MIQSWSDIADILKENEAKLKELKEAGVFITISHYRGHHPNKPMYVHLKAVYDKYELLSAPHTWEIEEDTIGHCLTNDREDLSEFIQKLRIPTNHD